MAEQTALKQVEVFFVDCLHLCVIVNINQSIKISEVGEQVMNCVLE